MKKEDLIYLANNISTLCGIPIRIYKNKELIHFYYTVNLVKDPFNEYECELFEKNEEIGYVTSTSFFFR